jgi:ElaB protein
MTKSADTSTVDDQAGTSVDDLKTLLREAEHALGKSNGGDTDEIQELRERLRDVLADGKMTLKNVSEALRRQAARADDLIRSKPYHTIGAAAALGLVAGLLLSRRRSDNA